ncbi:hypothetical protein B0H12DRAFT_1325721 [Mycena haematopus]|nr:hypothetical protein B0H12DRAFT_1325721 [Mycena haematopus]
MSTDIHAVPRIQTAESRHPLVSVREPTYRHRLRRPLPDLHGVPRTAAAPPRRRLRDHFHDIARWVDLHVLPPPHVPSSDVRGGSAPKHSCLHVVFRHLHDVAHLPILRVPQLTRRASYPPSRPIPTASPAYVPTFTQPKLCSAAASPPSSPLSQRRPTYVVSPRSRLTYTPPPPSTYTPPVHFTTHSATVMSLPPQTRAPTCHSCAYHLPRPTYTIVPALARPTRLRPPRFPLPPPHLHPAGVLSPRAATAQGLTRPPRPPTHPSTPTAPNTTSGAQSSRAPRPFAPVFVPPPPTPSRCRAPAHCPHRTHELSSPCPRSRNTATCPPLPRTKLVCVRYARDPRLPLTFAPHTAAAPHAAATARSPTPTFAPSTALALPASLQTRSKANGGGFRSRAPRRSSAARHAKRARVSHAGLAAVNAPLFMPATTSRRVLPLPQPAVGPYAELAVMFVSPGAPTPPPLPATCHCPRLGSVVGTLGTRDRGVVMVPPALSSSPGPLSPSTHILNGLSNSESPPTPLTLSEIAAAWPYGAGTFALRVRFLFHLFHFLFLLLQTAAIPPPTFFFDSRFATRLGSLKIIPSSLHPKQPALFVDALTRSP